MRGAAHIVFPAQAGIQKSRERASIPLPKRCGFLPAQERRGPCPMKPATLQSSCLLTLGPLPLKVLGSRLGCGNRLKSALASYATPQLSDCFTPDEAATLAAECLSEGDNSMRKLMILSEAVLLMSLAMAAYSTPAGFSDAIIVESVGATFQGSLQEPAITTVPMPHRN